MRYFVRTHTVSGTVEELEVWNGPYGFESREEAEADIDEFIEDANYAYDNGFLANPYDRSEFFVEAVDRELPYREAN